jgi:hypothetical protein
MSHIISHIDVDIPAALRPLQKTLLASFKDFVIEKQVGHYWTEEKQGTGHLTPWWLYLTLSADAPRASQVQFGATVHAAVNTVPHLWVRGSRGKPNGRTWITEGHALLQSFVAGMLRPPAPSRPPPRGMLADGVDEVILTARGEFDGTAYGEDYLNFQKFDMLLRLAVPAGVDPEGWSFGLHCASGQRGWFPGQYALA